VTAVTDADVGPDALGFYTIPQVAKLFGCSARAIERQVAAWQKDPDTGLESVKVGRLRRVPPEAVAAFRARLRAEARAGAA